MLSDPRLARTVSGSWSYNRDDDEHLTFMGDGTNVLGHPQANPLIQYICIRNLKAFERGWKRSTLSASSVPTFLI